MSSTEAERFAGDLKTQPPLLDELKKSAGGLGLSGVVDALSDIGGQFGLGERAVALGQPGG